MLGEKILNVKEKENVRFRKVNYPGLGNQINYFISEYGELYNSLTDEILYGSITLKGYRQFRINGISVKAHRLVAYAFVEKNRDIKLTVDHLDGNKLNNHYSNLEWVSAEENVRRAFESGTIKHSTSYSDDFVHKVCEMYEQYNYSPIELYRVLRKTDKTPRGNRAEEALYRFLVSLRKKEARKDISKLYDYDPDEVFENKKTLGKNSIFNKAQIRMIATMYLNGSGINEIAQIFGLETKDPKYTQYYSIILRIINRQSWTQYTDDIFAKFPDFVPTKKKSNDTGRFTVQEIHEICKYLANKEKPEAILNHMGYGAIDQIEFDRSIDVIRRIANGRTWRDISKNYFEPFTYSDKKTYDLNLFLISEMVIQNYSMKEICRVHGMKRKMDDPNLYRAIMGHVKKFRTLKLVSELTFKELQDLKMEEWAATW